MLTDEDRRQIAGHGLTEEEIDRQLAHFRSPPPPPRLLRPATRGDGILLLDARRHGELLARWQAAARAGRLMKFVPASGAATRMFEPLQASTTETAEGKGDRKGEADRERNIKRFLEGIRQFAFFDQLADACKASGFRLESAVASGAFSEILRVLLSPPPAGLGYEALPKALIPFHRDASGIRTPLEEHLHEAAETVRDGSGRCRVRFTVAPEWRGRVEEHLARVRPAVEREHGVTLEVGLSSQSPATDTIAVDEEDRPFRLGGGSLLLRPGGHGALLGNLEATRGDLVYVKNIDNVQPGGRYGATLLWKRLLAGCLLEALERPEARGRPVRVCGVVPAEGEPGGGPFWVAGQDGEPTLQIVESAQADLADPAQAAVWGASTHFNPVDLVCALKAPDGTPYRLDDYADPDAVFIARKSKDGRVLKALERPGLWNGAMARWRTLFVEVPRETFTPVKTVFDLLRPEHQPL